MMVISDMWWSSVPWFRVCGPHDTDARERHAVTCHGGGTARVLDATREEEFMPDTAEAAFTAHRSRLVGVAYRLLGSVGDAEDVVQEAWLRWARVDTDTVADPLAFLVRTVSRLALDRMRRVAARRETYVGPWLPEPVLTGGPDDPAAEAERAASVSMAMLVVLETLTPLERTVFVLHEAFAYSYGEIAEIVDRSPAAVRQLAHRAREHVAARRPRFAADPAVRRAATERFLHATLEGDLDALLELLAPDATLWADGGGKAKAPRRPIHGADKIARFFAAVGTEPLPPGAFVEIVEVNEGPAAVLVGPAGPIAVLQLDLGDDHRVTYVRFVGNPDKLAGLAALRG
jgi:RNA polymerase sigma-70 factor (TIGR02957 family)